MTSPEGNYGRGLHQSDADIQVTWTLSAPKEIGLNLHQSLFPLYRSTRHICLPRIADWYQPLRLAIWVTPMRRPRRCAGYLQTPELPFFWKKRVVHGQLAPDFPAHRWLAMRKKTGEKFAVLESLPTRCLGEILFRYPNSFADGPVSD